MKFKEYLTEGSLPAEIKGLTLKKSNKKTIKDKDSSLSGESYWEYDILNKKGKKVGKLDSHPDYQNNELFGRTLPDLGPGNTENKFHKFFKSNAGIKWLVASTKKPDFAKKYM